MPEEMTKQPCTDCRYCKPGYMQGWIGYEWMKTHCVPAWLNDWLVPDWHEFPAYRQYTDCAVWSAKPQPGSVDEPASAEVGRG